MNKHRYLDFASYSSQEGVTAHQHIHQDGYSLGYYLMEGCPDIIIFSTQMTVLQHTGEPLQIQWRLDDQDIPQQQEINHGQVHIIPPERSVHMAWSGRLSVFAVTLSINFMRKATQNQKDNIPINIDTILGFDAKSIVTVIDIIRNKYNSSNTGRSLSLACAMLANSIYEECASDSSSLRPVNGGLGPSRQRRVLTYIDTQLDQELSLKRLAKVAGLSPNHFGKAFRLSIGIPPLRYVAQRRLSRSKELLLDPELSITDIALRLGYATPSHFTYSFHRSNGLTPSQWRRRRL